MGSKNIRSTSRIKRQRRIRKKIRGTADRPRLSVFRSARHIYTQLVDDDSGRTLASASSLEKSFREAPVEENKAAAARRIGQLAARRAIEKGITTVVFDRNGFLYHGRVKAVSDGAREGGLIF